MYVNDALLKYCEFYVGHMVKSIQIKTTLFLTSCQSQSETGNKHGHQQSSIFVNYLAQSCVGSRQRSDVTRSIFCPNFLQAGYFHTWTCLDENLLLKTCSWFNPIIQWIKFFIVNTSTTYHRDEWLEHAHVMHDTCNYEIDMRRPKNHHFLVNHALGIMFTWFSIIFQEK